MDRAGGPVPALGWTVADGFSHFWADVQLGCASKRNSLNAVAQREGGSSLSGEGAVIHTRLVAASPQDAVLVRGPSLTPFDEHGIAVPFPRLDAAKAERRRLPHGQQHVDMEIARIIPLLRHRGMDGEVRDHAQRCPRPSRVDVLQGHAGTVGGHRNNRAAFRTLHRLSGQVVGRQVCFFPSSRSDASGRLQRAPRRRRRPTTRRTRPRPASPLTRSRGLPIRRRPILLRIPRRRVPTRPPRVRTRRSRQRVAVRPT